MISKKFEISSGDLTSGELLVDISHTKTIVGSNLSRTEISHPIQLVFFNDSGSEVELVFLSSGELTEYEADRTNYAGIRIPNSSDFVFQPLPQSKYVNVIANGAVANDIVLNFFQFR